MKHFLKFLSVVLLPLACVGAPSYTTYFNNTHTYTNASVAGTARVNSLVVTNGISSAANWTASGATNSTLPGVASANQLVATNAVWAYGSGTNGTFVGHPTQSAVFYGSSDFTALSYLDVISDATSSYLESYHGVYSEATPTTKSSLNWYSDTVQSYTSYDRRITGTPSGGARIGVDSTSGFLGFGSGSVPDTILRRDAANTLAMRNGTTAQRINIYGTYTDGSNYERVSIARSGTNFDIASDAAGTGVQRPIRLNGSTLNFFSANTERWSINGSGHLITGSDNVYDIGASGASRPRDVFVADDVVAGGDVTAGALLQNSGIRVMTPSSLQTLAAGNALLANATKVRVVGSGGAVTLTSTPTIADGTDGQYVMIQGTDNTNTLTVQDQGSLASSNLELGAATRVLGAGDVLVLTFDSTASVWYEVSFANN